MITSINAIPPIIPSYKPGGGYGDAVDSQRRAQAIAQGGDSCRNGNMRYTGTLKITVYHFGSFKKQKKCDIKIKLYLGQIQAVLRLLKAVLGQVQAVSGQIQAVLGKLI